MWNIKKKMQFTIINKLNMHSNAIGISPTGERYLQKAIQNMWNEKKKKKNSSGLRLTYAAARVQCCSQLLIYHTRPNNSFNYPLNPIESSFIGGAILLAADVPKWVVHVKYWLCNFYFAITSTIYWISEPFLGSPVDLSSSVVPMIISTSSSRKSLKTNEDGNTGPLRAK